MDNDWIKLLATTELYKARVTEALLKEKNIVCHVMNKQDSAYVFMGEIEIYVAEADKEAALSILNDLENNMVEQLETIVLGAGCFWCIEAVYQELEGVESVTSGYTGGEKANPTYEEVSSGTTGHNEVAKIMFDPAVISLDEILQVFWATHDPTTLNRQGYDVGTQYRSGIYYANEAQQAVAIQSKKEIAPLAWEDPIVTEIEPLGTFYEAEDYHHNYYALNPNYGYCRAIINPKMTKFRKQFKDKLKKKV